MHLYCISTCTCHCVNILAHIIYNCTCEGHEKQQSNKAQTCTSMLTNDRTLPVKTDKGRCSFCDSSVPLAPVGALR